MINAQSISDALGGKRSGDGFIAPCPAHDDHRPSLSITDGDHGSLVHCHAGCSQEAVIFALNELGLWQYQDLSSIFSAQGNIRAKTDLEAKQDEAARKAAAIMGKAINSPNIHPYAVRKEVGLGELVRRGEWPQRGWRNALLIPLYDHTGKLTTISAINIDGEKDLLAGGKSGGCFHPLGKFIGATGKILIGEGLATVAAAVESTGLPGVVAINAGNLVKVAEVVKQLAPAAEIIIIADDDRKPDGSNPGQEAAIKAAQSVGGKVAVPDLGKKADTWDLWKEKGPGAVKMMIEQAVNPEPACIETGARVELLRASNVTPEAVIWLWDGWLAAGKMHVLGGAPGTGKTTIALSLAATITSGGRWPDGRASWSGNVVIWSGEDDPGDTLAPRLALSGADMNRVYFVTGVSEGKEKRAFDPSRDIGHLQRELAIIGGVSLLIVDPIVSAVVGDSHKNAEVRRSLQPLADLAASMRCALLGITHFSKGTGGRDPVERLTGSLAFGALARIVFVAAKHQDKGEDGREKRLFMRAKSNIGPDNGGFEYGFEQGELPKYPGVFATIIRWGATLEGGARELLAAAEQVGDDDTGGALTDAKEFLSETLESGPKPVKTLKQDAAGSGISWPTIKRAKKALGIEANKIGMGDGWQWSLPRRRSTNDEEAQQKEMRPFGIFDPLREV